jgi:rhodanese-related sulfurtransferase
VEFYNSPFLGADANAPRQPLSFIIENWYLFAAAIASGTLLLMPMLSQAGGGGRISAADAVQIINREKGVLIDISEPAEYAAAHAVGAKNAPFAGLETSRELPKNKALPLVVVCPTGSRAPRAVAVLKKLGYENARVLAGGLAAWRAANLPVEKAA